MHTIDRVCILPRVVCHIIMTVPFSGFGLYGYYESIYKTLIASNIANVATVSVWIL